jgi:hypothetical protein
MPRRGRAARAAAHVEQVVEEQLAVGGDRPGRGGASIAARRSLGSTVPATPSRLRARLRIASRPVSAPKSSTAAAWQEKPSVRAWVGELGDEPRLADPGSPRTTTTRLRCRRAQAAATAANSRSSSSGRDEGTGARLRGPTRSPRMR